MVWIIFWLLMLHCVLCYFASFVINIVIQTVYKNNIHKYSRGVTRGYKCCDLCKQEFNLLHSGATYILRNVLSPVSIPFFTAKAILNQICMFLEWGLLIVWTYTFGYPFLKLPEDIAEYIHNSLRKKQQ